MIGDFSCACLFMTGLALAGQEGEWFPASNLVGLIIMTAALHITTIWNKNHV